VGVGVRARARERARERARKREREQPAQSLDECLVDGVVEDVGDGGYVGLLLLLGRGLPVAKMEGR
jgi:hypothetical protein